MWSRGLLAIIFLTNCYRALRSPRPWGYGKTRWRPAAPLTFDTRREIVRNRLQAGMPALSDEFASRTDPLESVDLRTTMEAFLLVEKQCNLVRSSVQHDNKLWDLSLSQRRQRLHLTPISFYS